MVLKDKKREPKVWWHRNKNNFWLHMGDSCLNISCRAFSKDITTLGAELYAADDFENTLGFSVQIPFVASLFVTLDSKPPKWFNRVLGEYCNRHYGFYVCPTHTQLSFHLDTMDSGNNRKFPSWEKFIDHEKLLKGKSACNLEEKVMAEQLITIPEDKALGYPELNTIAKVVRIQYTKTYTRWKKYEFTRWEVLTNDGAPYQGKGENGWDCGTRYLSDISFGTDANITNAEEALAAFVKEVKQLRAKYG